jgi:two-component system, cell cycle sensor histidine kinase and response regulator CckA
MPDVQTSKPASASFGSRVDIRTLLLAQKTEVIGELTRAIGNQFNNTMMAITSYAELELKKLPPSERRSLEQVLSNAARATSLVQKLLRISQNLPAANQPVDLNTILTEIGPLIEQLAGEKTQITYNLDTSLPKISADPSHVEQVVLSLTINARNAMTRGGKITFTTKLAELNEDSATDGQRLGKYVMLAVDDTGVQSPENLNGDLAASVEHDSRVNLSLAAVSAVVKDAAGVVRFASEPSKGSSFRIYFPPVEADDSLSGERSAPRNLPMARTVLIVEDDDAVRIPTAELLKMEGFKVLQARTGEEAIRVVEQNRSALDVLVTDVVMPKMSGHEVADKLLEMNPQLKVLFMSGEDVDGAKLRGKGATAALRKPFRLDVLKDKIHDLLDE